MRRRLLPSFFLPSGCDSSPPFRGRTGAFPFPFSKRTRARRYALGWDLPPHTSQPQSRHACVCIAPPRHSVSIHVVVGFHM